MGDLPFVHAHLPAYRHDASGLDVPCDGPHLLALDDEHQPICADCHTPLVRMTQSPPPAVEETVTGLMEALADSVTEANAARDRHPQPAWQCPRCRSTRWVSASLTGPVSLGGKAIRQCVPCGHYSNDPVPDPRECADG